MRFNLEMSVDNAAFADSGHKNEVARILREVADKLENGTDAGNCRDYNGNTVGNWRFTCKRRGEEPS